MKVGDTMQCELLASNGRQFKPTGAKIPVEIRQIKHDHVTQKPRSVKVRTLVAPERFAWVQAEMLS